MRRIGLGDRDAHYHCGQRNQCAPQQDSGQYCRLGDPAIVQGGQQQHRGDRDDPLRPHRPGYRIGGDSQRIAAHEADLPMTNPHPAMKPTRGPGARGRRCTSRRTSDTPPPVGRTRWRCSKRSPQPARRPISSRHRQPGRPARTPRTPRRRSSNPADHHRIGGVESTRQPRLLCHTRLPVRHQDSVHRKRPILGDALPIALLHRDISIEPSLAAGESHNRPAY